DSSEPPAPPAVKAAGRARRPSELVRPRLQNPAPGGVLLRAQAICPFCRLQTKPERHAPGQLGSGRMARVEGAWSLQSAVFGHQVRRRPARLAAPTETLLGDVILARPVFLARLTYSCLFANALSHGLVPLQALPNNAATYTSPL